MTHHIHPTFPERDQSKPAEEQGIFKKFEVRRTDGSDAKNGKHHRCRYFVLDMDHDKHAEPALAAYAASVAASHPKLAAQLGAEFGTARAVNFFRPADRPLAQWQDAGDDNFEAFRAKFGTAFEYRTLYSVPPPVTGGSHGQNWRVQAAAWLRQKARDQEKINAECPEHVKCYPSWTSRVLQLNLLANELDSSSGERAGV